MPGILLEAETGGEGPSFSDPPISYWGLPIGSCWQESWQVIFTTQPPPPSMGESEPGLGDVGGWV